jgi:hypothetical protein
MGLALLGGLNRVFATKMRPKRAQHLTAARRIYGISTGLQIWSFTVNRKTAKARLIIDCLPEFQVAIDEISRAKHHKPPAKLAGHNARSIETASAKTGQGGTGRENDIF